MKKRKFEYYVGDFETTVYKGQTFTEVWAAACVKFNTEDVEIFGSIDSLFEYLARMKQNICIFFHNLKFDGSFWIPFLEQKLEYKQAYLKLGDEDSCTYEWKEEKYMNNKEYKYMISDRGQWYSIIIKVNNKFIEIRDSLKLLPLSVADIGKSFGTKHKKLEMEYTGFRYANCEITAEEKQYIANDVLVAKEALEIMFQQGHNGLTIGSCCLAEFKKTYDKEDYKAFFPDLSEIEIDGDIYGSPNAEKYIRRSYKGGWCYIVKEKSGKIHENGFTADVNSLYPSMMHSESGNKYPIGLPKFWTGNFIPDEALADNKYYFVRIKTRFYIKKDMLPFIQIKSSFLYRGTESLKTSDVWDDDLKHYCSKVMHPDGTVKDTRVTLTLTMTDFELIKKHYDLVDFEILDGCYFYSAIGLFDEYINKYRKIKENSTGSVRQIAKLFLNNLYGKMASSDDSSFKVCYVKEDGVIGFFPVEEHAKKTGYIPSGSAITSYSRSFTITAAQQNFYGEYNRGFIYADTDSIHCDIPIEEVKGIKIHDKNFCCWKLESYWDKGIFTRQKTYIEHITHTDGKPIENPYYDVKCAGMPKKSKEIFIDGIKNGTRKLTDFNVGLKLDGKLTPKRIRGGVVLIETTYEMR